VRSVRQHDGSLADAIVGGGTIDRATIAIEDDAS
jgi:hypothetical protein